MRTRAPWALVRSKVTSRGAKLEGAHACGQSKRQPFCDGSHKTTEFTPVKFSVTEAQKVWLCGCKKTGSKPFCDGTHKKLAST